MDGEVGNQEQKADQKGGILDRRYYRGLLAIPKGVEVICSLIAYICVELEACTDWSTTYDYFKFISIAAMVSTLVLWILLLFKVPQRILRCDCVRWPFPELCYYAGVIILYFFGDLFLAIQQCGGGHEAGATFGFFALFAYLADAAWTGRTWWYTRKQLREGTQNQQQHHDVASPVEARY